MAIWKGDSPSRLRRYIREKIRSDVTRTVMYAIGTAKDVAMADGFHSAMQLYRGEGDEI